MLVNDAAGYPCVGNLDLIPDVACPGETSASLFL